MSQPNPIPGPAGSPSASPDRRPGAAPLRGIDILTRAGVSLWLDDLSRDRIESGSLRAAIADLQVSGVTTNPAIFHAAITGSTRYDVELARLAADGADAEAAVRALTVADVRDACDILGEVFTGTRGRDGWVSLEVDPRLAADTAATVRQARELAAEVDRPNLMIKVPATLAGLPAIEQLIAAGVSVNATLIFSLPRYREVWDSFVRGLAARRAAGLPLTGVHSVASVFVSRLDAAVDPLLASSADPAAAALAGRVAVAHSLAVAAAYGAALAQPRWLELAAAGATAQRPLWASTGVKNPAYPATRYALPLAVRNTVNTLPAATLAALHVPVPRVMEEVCPDGPDAILGLLPVLGIDLAQVTSALESAGVAAFTASWRALLSEVDHRLRTLAPPPTV